MTKQKAKKHMVVLLFAACWVGALVLPVAAQAEHVTTPPSASALDPTRRISQYAHTAWRIQNGDLPGLPEAITQTTDGYLWVGTFAGLVRFDGVRFVPWSALSKQPLPDDRVFSLLGASDGSLWIGTHKGLAHWKNGQLTTYLQPSGRFGSVVEDSEGTIWVARSHVTDTIGPLCKVDGDHLKCYTEKEGVPYTTANRMVRDDAGVLWIGGQYGLTRWTPTSATQYFQKELNQSDALLGVWSLAADSKMGVWACVEVGRAAMKLHHLDGDVWKTYFLPDTSHGDPGESALYADRDHTIWVGTGRRGIYRIHGNKVDHYTSGDGLTSDAIAGFYQDREGTLWVATSKGLDSFREPPIATYSIREGMSADSVSTVFRGQDGRVWIGNSGSLDFLKDEKISSILSGHGLPGRDVTTLLEDHAGRLWIGVDKKLWVYDQGRFQHIADGVVFSITEDTSHNIWVRLHPRLMRIQGLQVREEFSTPPFSKAHRLAADAKDGIWMALPGGELIHYRQGQMESSKPKTGESTHDVMAIVAEADGSVLGATDHGVLHLKDGVRTLLSSRNGLPCEDIYTMVKDDFGALWLYAKCGIVQIASSEMQKWYQQPASTISYRLFDGLDGAQPGITPLQPQSARSTDGRLWFSNDSLLQMIDPSRLPKNNIPPAVHIERIVADHKEYSTGESLKLPPRTRDLEIDYAALSFVVPQRVRYRYKLEGHDRDWQDPGLRRQALYNDLPPGKYKFRVIGCNNDGLWNETGAAVEFSLVPAFYQTGWFFLLCVASSLFVAWTIYQWRVGLISKRMDMQFEERLAERTRIAQDLHDTLLQGVLSASMQLHVVNDQMAQDAPAKPLMERVLELMTRVIDDGRNAVRGLRSSEKLQELDQAFSRIPQEIHSQQPMDFRVIVEGQPRTLHPVIRDEVYRIGREALVNALRHSGARNIEVELEYSAHHLRVMVRDDGSGIDEQVLRSGRDGHFGLSGMRERSERIGARFKVWSRPSGGTEVELSLPSHIAFRSHTARRRRGWFAGPGPSSDVGKKESGKKP
jgi:signal transduction histidine kinase/ligand-binding sensor domain-containing protein